MKTSFSSLMTRAAATLACAVLLGACGGGNQQASAASSPTAQSNDLTAKIQALEKSGTIPALDRSSSIAGPNLWIVTAIRYPWGMCNNRMSCLTGCV